MRKRRFELCLQLFNEGFASGGDGGAEGSNGPANLESQQEEPEIVYGIQDDDSDDPEDGTEGETEQIADDGADDYNSFRQKYKAEIGKEIQDAVSKRFKNQEDFSGKYNALNDALGPLYDKYGLTFGDSDALIKAINDDSTLYDEIAEARGLSPEAMSYQAKLERENNRLKAADMRNRAAEKARADYESWVSQAEELKEIYPGFDLAKEVENQDFIADLKAGKTVRKAYEAAHLDEILSGAVQATASNVRKSVVNSIAARGMRPSENGTKSRPGVVVKDDVNSLTDKDIDQILRQVKSGKKISF